MAVHQYIGARYVPYFYENSLDPTSTEWEPNVTYEPLTVVTLPNLHSYISKKLVPDTVGSPALNAEYWLDQGYASAYIQALQDQIDDLAVLLNDVQLHKTDKYLFISDSYGTGHISGGTYVDGLCKLVPQFMELDSDNFTTHAADGAGFTVSGSGGKYFIDLLNDSVGDFPDNDLTHIVVMGLVNDINANQTTLTNAIGAFKAQAALLYPDAKISLVLCGYNRADALVRIKLNVLAGRYSRVDGVNFYDQRLGLKRLPSYMSAQDPYHPSADGYRALSHDIAVSLLGGNGGLCGLETYYDANNLPMREITLTPVLSGGNMRIYESWMANDIVSMIIQGTINITGIAQSGYFKVGTLADNVIHGAGGDSLLGQSVSGYITLTNSNNIAVPLSLTVNNDELKLMINRPTTTAWADMAAVGIFSKVDFPAYII